MTLWVAAEEGFNLDLMQRQAGGHQHRCTKGTTCIVRPIPAAPGTRALRRECLLLKGLKLGGYELRLPADIGSEGLLEGSLQLVPNPIKGRHGRLSYYSGGRRWALPKVIFFTSLLKMDI